MGVYTCHYLHNFTLSDVWNNWSHEPSQIKAVLHTTTLIDTLQYLLFCQRFKQTHCIKVKYKNQFSQTDGLKKKKKQILIFYEHKQLLALV